MKKRHHFEIRGGHLENEQNLNGQRYFHSSNIQGSFMQNLVLVSTSEIFC